MISKGFIQIFEDMLNDFVKYNPFEMKCEGEGQNSNQ